MANSTLVTMQPPPGTEPPAILHIGPTMYRADSSGHFQVRADEAPTLIAAGWSYVVSGGTTHVP